MIFGNNVIGMERLRYGVWRRVSSENLFMEPGLIGPMISSIRYKTYGAMPLGMEKAVRMVYLMDGSVWCFLVQTLIERVGRLILRGKWCNRRLMTWKNII